MGNPRCDQIGNQQVFSLIELLVSSLPKDKPPRKPCASVPLREYKGEVKLYSYVVSLFFIKFNPSFEL